MGDESLLEAPFAERRARLEKLFPEEKVGSVRLTPVTTSEEQAGEWFEMFEGAGLDGIIVKPGDQPYVPDKRTMFKVKHERTADVVICGYREHKTGPIVGSLLLGLYGDDGRLHHVGVAASFPMKRRAELVEEIRPYLAELSEHPWGHWAEQAAASSRPACRRARDGRAAGAGGGVAVERQEGPVVHPAAAGAGDRGGLRPDGGRPVPAHRAVPPVAARPHARIVHL